MRRRGPDHNPPTTPAPAVTPKPQHESLAGGNTPTPKLRLKADLPPPSEDLALISLELELQDMETELTGLEALPLAEQDTGRINTVKDRISVILRKLGR